MAARECPMCGEMMRLQVAKVREWVCPECDYFEEADESD
jgi:transposase